MYHNLINRARNTACKQLNIFIPFTTHKCFSVVLNHVIGIFLLRHNLRKGNKCHTLFYYTNTSKTKKLTSKSLSNQPIFYWRLNIFEAYVIRFDLPMLSRKNRQSSIKVVRQSSCQSLSIFCMWRNITILRFVKRLFVDDT